ncbi:MAG: hypothetical protein QGG19_17285 [Alphaproteobacteria bacterium]|nr:hypothetical protein [Alphaproteobacteria bacterium]MDP6256201.1 hypothetical protein [Alphaproteobacteria bacterium]MDP7053216.1 hypothetical protein [Alphaproteobacteria bacterium]MDP7228505.1 hypothetical protein [Alphaproteobacteria bacterium]MDP7459245.1 hypothetical protein [Alphaproteobacteria bacterium]
MDKANQMLRVDAKGAVRRAVATEADLRREFGIIMTSLPTKKAKDTERRTSISRAGDDYGPRVYAWPVLAIWLLYLLFRWLRGRRQCRPLR